LPVVDNLAAEYGDRVAFVAPAWKGTPEDTAARAAELMPSGEILWGLDEEEAVFGAFGIPYQPATVLIDSDGRIVDSWAGARSEAEMRSALESLLAASG
jgi:hypothetical protein